MKTVKRLSLTVIVLLTISCVCIACISRVNSDTTEENSSRLAESNSPANAAQAEQTALPVENVENPPAVSPETVIKEIYAIHAQDTKANREDRIVSSKSRKYLDKYFDKNLADLIWKDLTTHTDEVGVIDFDLFYNAQDFDIKNLVTGKAKITGEKATVPVSFTNFGRRENLTYSFTQENGAWKISDIKYGGNGSLLKYFEEDAKTEAANKNFAGSYQVGETNCNVKATETAFELTWAKGTGTMKFYFQGGENGKYIFASEDDSKPQDKFIFDNETLKSGKFVRADGKEMTVKKIK